MKNILSAVELFSTNIIIDKVPDNVVYHTIDFTHRLISGINQISMNDSLSEEDKELLLIAGWLYCTGYKDAEMFKGKKIFTGCITCTQRISKKFLNEFNYPKDRIIKIFEIYDHSVLPAQPKDRLEKIFCDALYMDFAREKAMNYLKKMYNELLLFNAIGIGKKKWYVEVSDILEKHKYFTEYGKNNLELSKNKLITKVKKDYKSLEKTERLALHKALDISDAELKKLKKSLLNIKYRDERGIQTLFRTTSKNHYTLNTMIDRKANIMISVNSIIISLIIGGILGPAIDVLSVKLIPVFVMSLTSMISALSAVLAVRPDKTHGEFSENEVRNRQGNLLFFGNFHNMQFRDYEWAMLQMLNDKDYLYSSLIRDIYYLGQKLRTKHKFLRTSLNIFLAGTSITIFSFFIVKFLG